MGKLIFEKDKRGFMVFTATINNISVILWRSVLLWRKPEDPEKTTDKLKRMIRNE
jgi:hypothetical protein